MKTKSTLLFILTTIFMLPVFLKAQWNHVRFDQSNIFRKVFAATGNDAFVLGTGSMTGEYFLIRTADGGANWDSINININATYQLTPLYFTDVNNGFTGGTKNNTTQALLKTTDNGTNWIEITPDPVSTEAINSVYFITPLNGFAATASMLYATTNGGVSWTAHTLSFVINDMKFTDMNNGIVCGSNTTTYAAEMMKTTDGGQSWTSMLTATDPNLFVNSFLKQDILSSGTLFTSFQYSNTLFKSIDGGLTWDTIVVDSVFSIHDFQFTTPLLGHVLSDYGQIFVTYDGGQTWALEYATAWGLYGPSIYLNSLSFVGEIGYVAGTSGLVKKHDETNAINEAVNNAGRITVYPNPLSATSDLFIQTGAEGDCVIRIVNASGQIVFNKNSTAENAGATITLSGLHLAEGIYYLSVETKEVKATEKLVIAE
ncbi:MAG: YCF48-related protein [Bacteroidia bacterium]